MSTENQIIQEAEMEMSANVLIEAWESDIELSEADMCDHLDALLDVMEGKSSYTEFKHTTKLNGQTWLQ